MAWVAPPTFTSGAALTAAQLNTLSGDLNETAAGKATAAGQYFITTGANALFAQSPAYAQIDTSETTTSIGSYGDLATVGPSVTVAIRISAIIFYSALIANGTGGGGGNISYGISGATTFAAPNGHVLSSRDGIANESSQWSKVNWQTGLNNGTHAIGLKYTTPTGGTATFSFREILVLPF
jgi:hypothetical protein